MAFNLDDYEPVEVRLARFWGDHPEGRINTSLLDHSEDRYIVEAVVWRTSTQGNGPDATGLAEERVASSGVNKTSALENCETSAIGRALANLGYAAKGRASREEMEKVERDRPAVPGHIAEMQTYVASLVQGDLTAAREYVTVTMKELGLENPLSPEDCDKIKTALAEKLADEAPF